MDASVIVVGAGPAGLMLAGELRLAGVDVLVLERLAERTGESRGIGFTVRTMEVFDQRGLLPRFGDIETSTAGHFGGLPLDLTVLGAAHGAARTVPQSRTETVLEAWARNWAPTSGAATRSPPSPRTPTGSASPSTAPPPRCAPGTSSAATAAAAPSAAWPASTSPAPPPPPSCTSPTSGASTCRPR
ncbi:3-(3-hydroxy-phenyl)propionate/3-hydroxycinnamic acid hydroxylase [Streptomyces fumanus]